ncbi:uncharacterized protein LOC124350657 isoform X2 [Daphnia pulicaria]|uniref:uncharacterized protein LOC124350657 isoform X2 n=1 Tax=Daphnia pulicaria TaxID=35523 RepID=UPI001EE9F1B1|nr:uncharacterized protein LOC124350657 isoform X2 [Daphnia pulicaria]
MSKMNREPPKNVYSNNRLRKIAPAADHGTTSRSSHHQQHTSAPDNSGVRISNKPRETKVDRSLHFNKSQSKYQKHFEPNSPTKTLSELKAPKKLNEGPVMRQSLLNLKHPSRPGDLGIPLAHSYVQRKVSNNTQSHPQQPTDKKPRKNFDYLEQLSSSFGVKRGRLHSDNHSVWSPFQDSPKQLPDEVSRSELLSADEHVQGFKTALADTFEEVVKDNPEFVTATLRAKEELLKKLRSYANRQHEPEVDEDHIDDMDEGFSVFAGESSELKTPLPLNKMTSNFVATAHSSAAPAAHRFKSNFTPRQFLPRFQRGLGMSSNDSVPLASDTVSSKGSLEENLSLSQHHYKDYPEDKSESFDSRLPTSNRDKQPYYPQYYSLSDFQDHSNNRPY